MIANLVFISIAAVLGIMLFFSFVVAPVGFKSLNEKSYRNFIRKIFPFYYAPTLIYNLGNAALGFEIGATAGGSEYFDTTFLVYALNVIISFILISLFNVQEQIENPFDGDGMDDIQLENYELEY